MAEVGESKASLPTTENDASSAGIDGGSGAIQQLGSSNFNADTFLTNIRDAGAAAAGGASKIEIEDPKSLDRVKDLHGKLSHVVGSLRDKMQTVLRKQEGEFLAAYRSHMYNIQKELQDLRAKVDEEELQLKKDSVIQQLQGEREWYRNEALRLDTFVTNMKKDIEYMNEKLENVEDDRNWLEKQLKTAKKQNKLLRSKLEGLGVERERTSLVSPRGQVESAPSAEAASSEMRKVRTKVKTKRKRRNFLMILLELKAIWHSRSRLNSCANAIAS